MKIYGYIIHPACYLKDLHSRNDVQRCRVAGNFGFAFLMKMPQAKYSFLRYWICEFMERFMEAEEGALGDFFRRITFIYLCLLLRALDDKNNILRN